MSSYKSFGEQFLQKVLKEKKDQEKVRENSYNRLEKAYNAAVKDKDDEEASRLYKILEASDRLNKKRAA